MLHSFPDCRPKPRSRSRPGGHWRSIVPSRRAFCSPRWLQRHHERGLCLGLMAPRVSGWCRGSRFHFSASAGLVCCASFRLHGNFREMLSAAQAAHFVLPLVHRGKGYLSRAKLTSSVAMAHSWLRPLVSGHPHSLHLLLSQATSCYVDRTDWQAQAPGWIWPPRSPAGLRQAARWACGGGQASGGCGC